MGWLNRILVLCLVLISLTYAKPFNADFTEFNPQISYDGYVECAGTYLCAEMNTEHWFYQGVEYNLSDYISGTYISGQQILGIGKDSDYYYVAYSYVEAVGIYHDHYVKNYGLMWLNGTTGEYITHQNAGSVGSLYGNSQNHVSECRIAEELNRVFCAVENPNDNTMTAVQFDYSFNSTSDKHDYGLGNVDYYDVSYVDGKLISAYISGDVLYIDTFYDNYSKWELGSLDVGAIEGTTTGIGKTNIILMGGKKSASVLVAKDTGKVYKSMINKEETEQYTTFTISPLNYYSSDFRTAEGGYFDKPMLVNTFENSEDYVWLSIQKNQGYDAYTKQVSNQFYKHMSYNIIGDNEIYVCGADVSNNFRCIYGDTDDFKILQDTTIYVRLSSGDWADTYTYSCAGTMGKVCLVDSSNNLYAVDTYNLYHLSPSDYLPAGTYSVYYYDKNGDRVDCSNEFDVSYLTELNYYTIYTDGDSCNPVGYSAGYKISVLGEYGRLHVNLSDYLVPHSLVDLSQNDYDYSTNCTLEIVSNETEQNLTHSVKYKPNWETLADYTHIFNTTNETGEYNWTLTCDNIPNVKQGKIVVKNESGTNAGSIELLHNEIKGLSVNILKWRFTNGVDLLNLNDGVCTLTVNGYKYPTYLTELDYCSEIKNYGGQDCYACDEDTGENCYFYSVYDASNIVFNTNTTQNITISCTSDSYTAEATGNITFENKERKYTRLEYWDYKNDLVDVLTYYNDSNKDKFRFVGYILYSEDNPTPIGLEGVYCRVKYEYCPAISETEYAKAWKYVNLSMEPTSRGMVYLSDFLTTADLCNGRNLVDVNGVYMPDEAQMEMECTDNTGEYVIMDYIGKISAKTNEGGDVEDVGSGGIVGLSSETTGYISLTFTRIFDVMFFVGRIITNVMTAHMLETIIMIILLILISPFLIGRIRGGG